MLLLNEVGQNVVLNHDNHLTFYAPIVTII